MLLSRQSVRNGAIEYSKLDLNGLTYDDGVMMVILFETTTRTSGTY